jgi:uncharacterized protein (DUF2147 family)
MKAPSFAPRLLLFFLMAALGLSVTPAFSQNKADEISGVWLTQDKDAHVQIFKGANGKFYGKIAWLERTKEADGSVRLDIKNPDESKRKNLLMGTLVLYNFDFDTKTSEYVNGFVYDSESGTTYTSFMKMNADGTLFLKGYVLGMRWMGRTNTWTRVK